MGLTTKRKKKQSVFKIGSIFSVKDDVFSNIFDTRKNIAKTSWPLRTIVRLKKNDLAILTDKEHYCSDGTVFYRLKFFLLNCNLSISVSGSKKELLRKFNVYAKT